MHFLDEAELEEVFETIDFEFEAEALCYLVMTWQPKSAEECRNIRKELLNTVVRFDL